MNQKLLLLGVCLIVPSLWATTPYAAYQGYAALQQGDLEAARLHYEDAVAQDPENMHTLFDLGMVAHKQKDYDKARTAFELIKAHHQDREQGERAEFMLGDVAFMKQELERAKAHYQEVLKRNPEHTAARERLELLDQQKEQNQSPPHSPQNNSDNQQQDQDKDQGQQESQQQSKSDQKDDSGQSEQERTSAEDQEQMPPEQPKDQTQGQQDRREEQAQQQRDQRGSKENAQQDGRSKRDDQAQVEQKEQANKAGTDKTEQKKEHSDPQDTSKKPIPSNIPEKKLPAQLQKDLEELENQDNARHRKYFLRGRRAHGAPAQPGQKRW